jgi:site-specific DNA-methyltransferase (adenine-specific)
MSIRIGKVAMIPMSDIEVSDRARQELGDLTTLECSLKESGLIQPLAVQDMGNGKFRLLAGERRYTVLLSNQVCDVPVRVYGSNISELERKIIEKAENFYRKDFEYWEHDALVAEIDRLEREVHGSAAPGPGHEGHKLSDTAEVFGITGASVSTAIKRHEAREAFPELFERCKTQKDATNVIKKMDEAIIKKTIAEKIDRDKSSGSTLKKLANGYILKDFFIGVKEVPDESIHLVEIDPPYAIDLKHAKKSDNEELNKQFHSNYNEVAAEEYQVFISKVFSECYRVMADHSWLICWFAPEPWFEVIYQELNNAGFSTTRMCGIWSKPYGQSKRPEMHLANCYEMFFYAWKGRPALNSPGRSNIFAFPPVAAQNKTHPTERPIELMQEIYSTFAFPGSRILIPFLGSGSGLMAAHRLGMSAMGFELGKGYRDSFLVKVHNMQG